MTQTLDMRFVIASSLSARARGLLCTDASWGSEKMVMVLCPCKSIHTIGMRYTIDVAFLNRNGIVLRSERALAPGHIRWCKQACLVLERPSSEKPWFEEGQALAGHIAGMRLT